MVKLKNIFLISFLFSFTLLAQIKFDANFESGNIDTATTVDSVNWTVKTISDIGGRWFYFRISGVKDKFISVTISNSDVKRAMYSYDNKDYLRFSKSESIYKGFQKTFTMDTVFVAYYTPYTYSYLQEQINKWSKSPYVRVDTIGITPHNFPMQELIITDFSIPENGKFKIWIHARTHPGETPSSYHFDGIVNELLSNDDVIKHYRERMIFYLVPFNNPEGVFYGRSRTNYFGIDQEREWDKNDTEICPEVKALRDRLIEINSTDTISVLLNLHSQAAPYCTFWIHTASSTSDYFYRRQYQFSNLNTSDNPYFSQQDYEESNLQGYFPEGWIWNNCGDKVMALTYETPYDYYSNDDEVTIENLHFLGERTLYSIAEYFEISHPKYLLLDNKNAIVNGSWQTDTTGRDFYSDNYYTAEAGVGNNSVTFQTPIIEKGIYDIYGWWQALPENAIDTKIKITADAQTQIIERTQQINGGQWNYLQTLNLQNGGTITITITDSALGKVVADAFRIIYRGPLLNINKDNKIKGYGLIGNYPNPFNPTTTIRFKLNRTDDVKINVFNTLGQLVAVLVDKKMDAGEYEIVFDAKKYSDLASGIYYYQMITSEFSETKGMVLVK